MTSNAGNGVGYTGISIRGTDANRINVTINGIPVNDPEDHGTFWVNMPDLASSVNNIQVQRGVGTSSNGAAAFGASLNIQTSNLSKVAYGQLSSSCGSFNTFKNTFQVGTGLLNNKFAFETRLSKISSDGFIDRASSDLKSFYTAGTYYGKRSLIKAIIFSGREKTYQAWAGVPESILSTGNRTYNLYTYDNQTDNYQQDYYQLHYTNEISKKINLNTSLFYTRGRGYYEEFWSENDPYQNGKLSLYGISDLELGKDTILGNDTVNKQVISYSDVVRQKWLDNHFYGITFSANYDNFKKLKLILGGGVNQFQGGHYGKVVWARYAGNSNLGDRYYNNDGLKNDGNIYAKAYYTLFKKLTIFGDAQYRLIDYRIIGTEDTYATPVYRYDKLNFFNPKAGITYDLNQLITFYGSYSIAHKEPTRTEYIYYPQGKIPLPEKLNDFEFGFRARQSLFQFAANFYYMLYKNQLVVTGQVNDVGNPIRINVPNSYRRGIEIQAGMNVSKKLNFLLNTTLSQNKILDFVYNYSNFDSEFQPLQPLQIQYKNRNIAYSPNIIVGGIINLLPLKELTISFLPKYVGSQYFDNTQSEERKLNSYFLTDMRISYTLPQKLVKDFSLYLLANNIFDQSYISSAISYSSAQNSKAIYDNYYFPQPGINFLAGLSIKF